MEKRAADKILLVLIPHCSVNKDNGSGELWQRKWLMRLLQYPGFYVLED